MSTSNVNEIEKNAKAAEEAAEKAEKRVAKLKEVLESVFTALKAVNKPGMELSTSMHNLAAMSGIAGDKLNEIEGYARKSAKTFGGSAATSVESYRLLLTQLSPEIAKVPKALDQMGKSVAITSKLMGGDQAAATELLTTAMNQYQVSLDNPIAASAQMAKMMNVMVAATGKGSITLPKIKQALDVCGASAKMANVSFEETNAALQILDKAGSKGAEGGKALHNVLEKIGEGEISGKLEKQLEGLGVDTDKLTDKNTSLAERLNALKPALKDGAVLSAWLGEGTNGATQALIAQIPELQKLTAEITDTNSAYAKAATAMDAPSAKNEQLRAQIDDFKISIFNLTGGLLGYADVLGEVTTSVTNLSPVFLALAKTKGGMLVKTKLTAIWSKISAGATRGLATAKRGLNTAMQAVSRSSAVVWLNTKLVAFWSKISAGATRLLATAQWGLNAAMNANPVGVIILGVMALATYITYAIMRWDEFGAAMLLVLGPIGFIINGIMTFRKHWDSITAAFNSGGIIGGLRRIGEVFADTVLYPVQQLLELMAKIPWLESFAGGGAEKIKNLRASMDLVAVDETKKAKKTKDEIEGKAGIKPPTTTIPPTTGNGKKNLTDQPKNGTNEAIANGGAKNTVINITLKDLIGVLQISGKDFKDSANQMKEQTQDALIRVLASANTAAG
jgi:TP901 family phage tail tape measure protein